MLYLPARDLAAMAPVSKLARKCVNDAVGLACVTMYSARLPQQRPGESITRLLQFVESVTVAMALGRVGTHTPSLSAGTYHSFVLSASGSLFGFGDAAAGQVRLVFDISCTIRFD